MSDPARAKDAFLELVALSPSIKPSAGKSAAAAPHG